MNVYDYSKVVQEELRIGGFTSIKVHSISRISALTQDGKICEIKVKYCIEPRKLWINDTKYIAEMMSENTDKFFITN